jgi:hypothetical protein
VHYRVSGTVQTLFACHCTECQRQSASAFGMALWVQDAQLALEGPALREWVRSTPSGKQMACRFCPSCGTRLFHQVLAAGAPLSIKPGTLNAAASLRPVAHIWTASKQPWVQLDAEVLQYPGNPPAWEPLLQAWHAAQGR